MSPSIGAEPGRSRSNPMPVRPNRCADEEKATDQKLTAMAESKVNQKAA